MKKSVFLFATLAFLLMPVNSQAVGQKVQEQQVSIQNNYYENIDFLIGNFTNPIKLVFSDIDGTLLPLDPSIPRGTVPDSVKKAAAKLTDAGIPLILVTGRSANEAKTIAQKIGLKESYVIAQQGAVIVDGFGATIYEDGIKKKEVEKILKDLKTFNEFHYTDVKPFLYVNGKLYTFKYTDLPFILDKQTVIKSINDLGKDFTAVKIGLYETNPKTLKAVQRYLKLTHPKYNIDISAYCFCDVSSPTARKGNAVDKLSQKLGIDLSNVATFGDAENDISMLRLLKDNGGLAIAVDNAIEPVKASSNYVTKSVSNGGFLVGVDAILKNNKLLTP